MDTPKYVIITPARNEEAYIEKTIQSVISQTILPRKWIVVSDGSTDRTDEIVDQYVKDFSFIKLLRAGGDQNRNFGSKVNAFNAGYETLGDIQYDYIGNLDADVSFDKQYYETILSNFALQKRLGIAGGAIQELINKKFVSQNISLDSVAGAVQLFRRACYDEVGGYTPMKGGGIDAIVEIKARMHGWKVHTFPELKVLHYRRVAKGKGNILSARFRQGVMQYFIGYHPFFFMMRNIYKLNDNPFLLSSLFRVFGYFWAMCNSYDRPVSKEFVKFIRNEQLEKLKNLMANKNG